MKAIYTFILLTIFQFAVAQDIDSTIVFETEQVADFKKQTILEEYQVPYENDIELKRLFRLGTSGNIQPGFIFGRSDFYLSLQETPFDWEGLQPSTVSFMQRIGKVNAVMVGVGGGSGGLQGSRLDVALGFRKYVGIKEEIENKRQKFNFTGKYIGLEGNWSFVSPSNFPVYSLLVPLYLPYQDLNKEIGLVYGLQLRGFLDIYLKAGLKQVRQAEVLESERIRLSDNPSLIPFVSVNSFLSISQEVFMKKRIANCDFLNCERQVDHLLKLDLNRSLYLDPIQGRVRFDVAYEQRLGKSNFSISPSLQGELGYRQNYSIYRGPYVSESDFPISVGGTGLGGFGEFSNYSSDTFYEANTFGSARLDMRYYAFKKKEVLSGKSGQNFNGFYFNTYTSASYRPVARSLKERFSGMIAQDYQIAFGVGLGYQKKIGSKYFYDAFLSLNRIDQRFPNFSNFNNNITIGTKFGFAK